MKVSKVREYKKRLSFVSTKNLDDIEKLYNYDAEVFTDSPDFVWSLDNLKKELKEGWKIYSVMLDNEIVAAAFLKEEKDGLHTKNTPVKLIYQGNGFSHQIKDFFEDQAREMKIHNILHYCSSHNFRMISLNESHGYERLDTEFAENQYLTEWKKII
jgi:predicted GNAT family acetyltransferase